MAEINYQRVAKSFSRLGWTGFWAQLVLAIVPLCMFIYIVWGRATSATVSLGVMDCLALVGLAVLVFTTFWSYRYAALAKRIADPERRPKKSFLTGVLWIGLWAGLLGIAISLVLMFLEVLRLLFLFLTAPQGGVPVVQTQTDNRTEWVSALDVVSLLAELCTLTGELLVLGLTLYLLWRVSPWPDNHEPAQGV
jgi:hypothetical protein